MAQLPAICPAPSPTSPLLASLLVLECVRLTHSRLRAPYGRPLCWRGLPQRVTQLNPSPPSSFAQKVTFSGNPRAPLFTGMAPLHLHFFCSASSFSTKGSLSNVPGNPHHTWSFVRHLPHLLQLHLSRAELLILFLKVWWWFSR